MPNFGILRRLRDDTAGNTLALCAAAIIPLTAVIGSALDLSVAYMSRAKLQTACDAGVLAGRQFMTGTDFGQDVEDEARKFFDFNFPAGTSGSTDLRFTIAQDTQNQAQLLGSAEAAVPTSMMRIFGFEQIPITVSCDATRDLGHNDVVLVLDVTGSMNFNASGGGKRIDRLRTGAIGIYRALDSDDGSVTRFGIVPYSHTVNVGRALDNRDILTNQTYAGNWIVDRCRVANNNYYDCVEVRFADRPETGWVQTNQGWRYDTNRRSDPYGSRVVHISRSSWNNAHGNSPGNTQGFRESDSACIEERPSVGTPEGQFRIESTITQADVDTRTANASDNNLLFGRYDPAVQRGHSQDGCPARATRLREYDSDQAFQNAIDAATSRVTGGTYHDVGMLWGARFISRTGFFAGNNLNQGDNVTEIDGIPVNTHIVFMTDGELDTGETLYSAHGVERFQNRTKGGGTLNSRHLDRFHSVCRLAQESGTTVWVIALDVGNTADIESCATGPGNFFVSDGADLEEIFERIGQGIGNLRLTR